MTFQYLNYRKKYINNNLYYIYLIKINNYFYKIITKNKFNGIYHFIKKDNRPDKFYDQNMNEIIILNQFHKNYLDW
jgi:hypothetical protein